jgi:hypothetical protein
VVLVSVYPAAADGFDLNAIVGAEKTLIGTLSMSRRDTEEAVRRAASRAILIPFSLSARAVLAQCSLSSEKDTKLAQKLGQLQPFIAVFPQECVGQLASFGPT